MLELLWALFGSLWYAVQLAAIIVVRVVFFPLVVVYKLFKREV